MHRNDPRVDDYIERSAEFARPILHHLRGLVQDSCPEVEETMKWNFPHFMYHGILCSMAAFGQHCAFGFWKGALIVEEERGRLDEAMGQFGRIRSVEDLPEDVVIAGYIRAAMRLNEEGVRGAAGTKRREKPPIEEPGDLLAGLSRDPSARATYDRLTPSQRRDYVLWLTEARKAETRAKRLATALEWLAEGKARNWKYERKRGG